VYRIWTDGANRALKRIVSRLAARQDGDDGLPPCAVLDGDELRLGEGGQPTTSLRPVEAKG